MALMFEDAAAREHAYLVARGVRALALVAHYPAAEGNGELPSVTARLQPHATDGALPFVWDRGDGFVECGYAAAPWVLELYQWATRQADDAAHGHRIVGLLLGYSVRAISDFENARSISTSSSAA